MQNGEASGFSSPSHVWELAARLALRIIEKSALERLIRPRKNLQTQQLGVVLVIRLLSLSFFLFSPWPAGSLLGIKRDFRAGEERGDLLLHVGFHPSAHLSSDRSSSSLWSQTAALPHSWHWPHRPPQTLQHVTRPSSEVRVSAPRPFHQDSADS